MEPSLQASRLLSRATFGARPGDRAALDALGPGDWLENQLQPGASDDSDLARRLRAFSSLGRDPAELLVGIRPMSMNAMGHRPRPPSQEEKREMSRVSRRIGLEASGARLVRAVHGQRGLAEVMLDFFANHFSVGGRKPLLGPTLPHYLDSVLRPFVLGRFEDLLVATAKSPAMLIYLDNWNSTAPIADLDRRDRRARRALRRGAGGINENYARELLELHTLGVDGGYDQNDVVAVAAVFTGWSLESRDNPTYRYRDALHVPGSKRVLGQPIREAGENEGRLVLRRLARHPATARHLAAKLVQRFVADAPPPALVERAARRYLERDGEIAEVLRVIFTSPEFAAPDNRKLKTPLRLFASALRATGGSTDGGPGALRTLERMGEVPFGARSPAGYPEAARHWIDPGAVLERMNLGFALARDRIPGTRLGSAGLEAATATRDLRRSEAVALSIASRSFQWA
ncbi:MAG: DUF1800 domain-containing protein [Myxococcota bacterium]